MLFFRANENIWWIIIDKVIQKSSFTNHYNWKPIFIWVNVKPSKEVTPTVRFKSNSQNPGTWNKTEQCGLLLQHY